VTRGCAWRATTGFVVAAALLALGARPAGAVSPAAEALFQEGRKLLAAGKTAEACARFRDSYALDASSGTLLNLARCHEMEGKIATAWTEYQAAARLSRSQGRDDRAAVADEKARSVDARLPRLTWTAANPAPGLEIVTDAGTLRESDLGQSVPVDPGVHPVKVGAPGHRPWTTTVAIQDGERRTVEIPPLEVEPTPARRPPIATVAAPTSPPALISASRADAPPAPTRSSLDLYLAGGGAIGVVAGTVIWSVAYAKFQSAKDACNPAPGCTDRASRVSTIETLQRVAIGSWVAGGALLVASELHFRFRKGRAPVTVAIDPRGGFSLSTTF
jgi:hypothetical protein